MPSPHWNVIDYLFEKALLDRALGTILRESVYSETAGGVLPCIFGTFWKCLSARTSGWRSSHMKILTASRCEVDAKPLIIINTEHTLIRPTGILSLKIYMVTVFRHLRSTVGDLRVLVLDIDC